jgi:hypothetical protein
MGAIWLQTGRERASKSSVELWQRTAQEANIPETWLIGIIGPDDDVF